MSGIPAGPHRLSRALLAAGGLDAILAAETPSLRLLSDAERGASLRAALAARPPGDAWLFAYGSLIWHPTVRCVERRIARAEGWHRAFCLSIVAGRGSLENPGLALALAEGGACDGVALRLADGEVESELALLWRREMVTGAYLPRWIAVRDRAGRRFGHALAFVIDTAGDAYAGGLETAAIVHRLATASGSLGSAADYLFRTRDELRACGIPDAELERLATAVEAAIANGAR